MSHISPLKKLFRRQKALRGVGDLLPDPSAEGKIDCFLGYPIQEADFCGYSKSSWHTIDLNDQVTREMASITSAFFED